MKQQRPVTIADGRLVTPDGLRGGTLRLVNGMIDAIDASAQDGDETIDANGALVAPGLVDLGVFAIDKPAFHFGGITRAALMPDQSPPLDLPSRVSYIAKSGKPDF
ncbi:MAG: dihydroorotase, partial [Pseudomonadota bacterium]|nr:dihydroorotase [Pseudomonadota bacterium]